MDTLLFLLPFALLGIGIVTLIDIIGSVASRKYNFSYGYFTVFSILAYVGMSAIVYGKTGNPLVATFLVLLIGLYDGTVGWWISKKLSANYGSFTEEAKKMTVEQALLKVLLFSLGCAGIGIFIVSEFMS